MNEITLDLAECAEFLKIDPSTASTMASNGILPGAKIGRAWVFPLSALSDYLHAEVKRQQRERLITKNLEDRPTIECKPPSLRKRKSSLSEVIASSPHLGG